jgi:hypothetical protein
MADEPKSWIPGESDFANAQYLSRPKWWVDTAQADAERERQITASNRRTVAEDASTTFYPAGTTVRN